MDAAKNAVKGLLHRDGHHDTEVDEHVRPAVTQETVKPHRHEETTQAVDREVHQDHYHTTVQPLQHKEVLPEQHTHQQMPVQEREIHHGDTERVRSGVEAEAAKFANTSQTHQTTHTSSQAPVAAGEHVHHHVHETVQPVIHKETVQPEVVHTTVPIHETHHAQAEHHGMSTLPTKTLAEFEKLGGKVAGAGHRHEEYEGHPRPYNPEMQTSRSAADREPMAHDGLHGTHSTQPDLTSNTGSSGQHTGLTGGSTGQHTGLTGDSTSHTGLTGGTTGTHVSGLPDRSTNVGHTSGVSGPTGTSLGGRTEGNTASRALDAATSHGSTGVGHGVGSTGTSGIRSEDNTAGYSSLGGATSHHDRGLADTSSSTNTRHGDTTGDIRSDVQTPSQGKDPSLTETGSRGTGLRGDGVDGSHSAVFGLTPDGHKHDDTTHHAGSLKPAHTKPRDNSATGDVGSRAPTGSSVADQLNDPGVLSKGHGGPSMSDYGSAKPGAGAPGGEQGFGQIRPQEHGTGAKIQDKLDPTTDADNDGKRGIGD